MLYTPIFISILATFKFKLRITTTHYM